jgi:hypothetical protein
MAGNSITRSLAMTTIDTTPTRAPMRVQVVRFDIPFFQLVWLLIKVAIAAIPAAIIFALVTAAVTAVIGMMFGGVFGGFLQGIQWI